MHFSFETAACSIVDANKHKRATPYTKCQTNHGKNANAGAPFELQIVSSTTFQF